MFVILTSKPGKFHTEVSKGLKPIEAWDYRLDGKMRVEFIIAEITGQPRVTIVDETPPQVVNCIPSKVLPRFASIDRARHELTSLANISRGYTLERRRLEV